MTINFAELAQEAHADAIRHAPKYVILMLLLALLAGCDIETNADRKGEPTSRFEIIEDEGWFTRGGNPNVKEVYEPHAYVVLDTETGIEYLYIWEGSARGGPAVTRLWKEGDQ